MSHNIDNRLQITIIYYYQSITTLTTVILPIVLISPAATIVMTDLITPTTPIIIFSYNSDANYEF